MVIKMKKILSVLLILILVISLLAGCVKDSDNKTPSNSQEDTTSTTTCTLSTNLRIPAGIPVQEFTVMYT